MAHPGVYLMVAAGAVRVALRVFFIVALLLIALVGDRCCHFRTQLQLLRGQKAILSGMTGWVRGFTSFGYLAKMRRLPGGWLGILMMLAAVIGIAADIAVSAFVTHHGIPAKCDFQQGLVLRNEGIAIYPTVFGAAYAWANAAQYISSYNDGYWGIFQKADNNTAFYADDDDLIGYWECTPFEVQQSFDEMDDLAILTNLVEQGYLYESTFNSSTVQNVNGQISANTSQLLLVGLNLTWPDFGTPWDVKIAVDMSDDMDESSGKVMQVYDCHVHTYENDNGIIETIMSTVNPWMMLPQWQSTLNGNIWLDPEASTTSGDVKTTIEVILNNMIMVAGAGNSISRTTNDKQGCIYPGTKIPFPIVALCGFVAMFAAFMIGYCTYLYITMRLARRQYDRTNSGTQISSKEIVDSVPNGLLDWMVHAAKESNHANVQPRHHHINKWLLTAQRHGSGRVGIVHEHQFSPHSPASATSTNFTATGSPPTPFASYLGQKTEYTAVQSHEIH